jgi:hypothetical protein
VLAGAAAAAGPGAAVAEPGGWEIKQWITPLMCRACKRSLRRPYAARRDEQDQPRTRSNIQQEKYPDINGCKKINRRI